ncbi:MAG: ATP-binding protein [Defluviicoccus sp.]|nr:ATP-binding protein [Defluviicoccus sp.]MDE0278769.1 ATP-binding protein [Defluviicoccus sp.]
MREISSTQRHLRLRADNSWWDGAGIREDYGRLRPRAYFRRFAELVEQTGVRRAVVLMGPRRVGKTVLLHHAIARLLAGGDYAPGEIGYASLDQPLYARLSIEEMAGEIRRASGTPNGPRALFLDEIQYLADWERHLKAFVDAHPGIRCVVSGSSAAALRLKSMESGAGRFTDFLLPPLTFHEYLDLQGIEGLVEPVSDGSHRVVDLEALNAHFIDYVNFGGFPEAVSSPAIRTDPARYIGADIVDKVLLRDLPSLYGIQDVQELNALFMTLVFNTAEEVSLEELSQRSGVTKPTIKRYLEYLEAAFLIRIVHRIDRNARRFRRTTSFKVYAATPSLRCALFGPVAADDEEMGPVAETAVFAQWFHAGLDLHYARWRGGEVDIVALDRRQSPDWCVEVKWSDRHFRNPGILKGLREFARRHPRAVLLATTRTDTGNAEPWGDGSQLSFTPTSLYCYLVGQAAIRDPSATGFRAVGGREGDLSRYLERAPDAPPEPGDELPG